MWRIPGSEFTILPRYKSKTLVGAVRCVLDSAFICFVVLQCLSYIPESRGGGPGVAAASVPLTYESWYMCRLGMLQGLGNIRIPV